MLEACGCGAGMYDPVQLVLIVGIYVQLYGTLTCGLPYGKA